MEEDWRDGRPAIIDDVIVAGADGVGLPRKPAMNRLARSAAKNDCELNPSASAEDSGTRRKRSTATNFIYEAGLVEEALRDGREAAKG